MDFISEYAVEIILVLSGILVGVINTLAGGGAIITMTLFNSPLFCHINVLCTIKPQTVIIIFLSKTILRLLNDFF